MANEIGRLTSVGIGKETTRKTAVAPTYWVPWAELTLEERVTTINDEASLGVIEDSDAVDVVKKWTEFSVSTKLKDDHFGLWLLSLFGSVSSAVKETTAYNHTFTVAEDNTHETLTIAEKSGNEDLRYSGAVVDTLEINAVLGDYVRYTVGGKAQLQASASNTVSHAQEYDFKPQDVVFKHAADQSSLDGASETKIREFSLSFSQNLFDDDVLGSVTPDDFLNQQWVVTGSVTLVHDGSTFQDYMLAGTQRALRFDMIGSETIGASSNPELKIDFHKVFITNYERTRALNEIVLETFEFKAVYSLDDSALATVILTNEETSY